MFSPLNSVTSEDESRGWSRGDTFTWLQGGIPLYVIHTHTSIRHQAEPPAERSDTSKKEYNKRCGSFTKIVGCLKLSPLPVNITSPGSCSLTRVSGWGEAVCTLPKKWSEAWTMAASAAQRMPRVKGRRSGVNPCRENHTSPSPCGGCSDLFYRTVWHKES